MPLFSKIINNLQKKTPLTIVSTTNVRNWALRKCMLNEMQKSSFGAENAGYFAEPFFEAMFPWRQNSSLLIDQVNLPVENSSNVHNIVRQLHVGRNNEPIPRLYEHQAKALKGIREGKSIVVTTGTGSGKTECFMYPIYDYLARQIENGESIGGVQALFLYPLNALIESQGDRFRKFCATFNQWCRERGVTDRVHFANYTGSMEENPEDAIKIKIEDNPGSQASDFAYEVYDEIIDRTTLRKRPPQFLITNSTMLEYAMVRKSDAPIFKNKEGRSSLKFIVLDEAHTYSGSNAAELALRLRRVLEAFGTSADQVQFIATSASIGDEDKTKKFLSDISGVKEECIDVISGKRDCEDLALISPQMALNDVIGNLKKECLSKEDRYKIFQSCEKALDFRRYIKEQKRLNLKFICDYLGVDSQSDVLSFLDYASECGFIPLKAHLFQKQFFGVWACCNPKCSGKQTELKNEEWKYGRVFFDLQNVQNYIDDTGKKSISMYACPYCGHNVFLVVDCENCGEIYLAAQGVFNNDEESAGEAILRIPKLLDEVEDDSSEDEEDNQSSDSNKKCDDIFPALLHASDSNREKWTEYVVSVNSEKEKTVHLVTQSEKISQLTYMKFAEKEENRCVKCKGLLHIQNSMNAYGGFPLGRKTHIMGFSVPAKTIYSSLVNDVLREDPVKPNPNLPMDGKKILTFTDSRQGSATYAGKQGIIAEMETTRVWMLKKMLLDREVSCNNMRDCIIGCIDKIYDQMKLGENKLTLKEVFHLPQKLRDKLQKSKNLARLFLWRELTFRSRRKRSLESLGFLQVDYDGLERIKSPEIAAIPMLRFSDEEYRSCLKIILDYGFRQHGSMTIDDWDYPEIERCYGGSIHIDAKDMSVFENPFDKKKSSENVIAKILLYYLTDPEDKSSLSDLIKKYWNSISALAMQIKDDLEENDILEEDDGKWYVNWEKIRFSIPRRVWLCPTTSSLLDVVIENPESKTKYTPFILGRSNPVRLKIESEPIKIADILPELNDDNTSDCVKSIRSAYENESWWSDLHECVLSDNPDQAFVVTQENSAQISADQRRRDQHMFVDGKINIMNCSTTMEMGVDIGGVSLVAMTNVPPHEYNYLQRAGRAGRSSQTQSFVWTLASFGKHERKALENPLAWVNTNTVSANVTHYGRSILQRHVNAYLLNSWLCKQTDEIGSSANVVFLPQENKIVKGLLNFIYAGYKYEWENPPKIEDFCDEMRLAKEQSLISKFIKEIDRFNIPDSLLKPFDEYVCDESDLKAKAKIDYQNAQNHWIEDLCDYYRILRGKETSRLSREVLYNEQRSKVLFYIENLLSENGLKTLIEKGVLPSNSMPVGVVELVLSQDDRKQTDKKKKNPSRERRIAIREFAPCSSIVVNGIRRLPGGIEFKDVLYGNVQKTTVIKKYMTCNSCGFPVIESAKLSEIGSNGPFSLKCSCGRETSGTPRFIVEPLKFLSYKEDRSVDSIAKSAYERPHVTLKNMDVEKQTISYRYAGNEVIQMSWGDAEIVFLNGNGNAKNENGSRCGNATRKKDIIPGMPQNICAASNNDNQFISEDDHYRLCTYCGFMYSDDQDAKNVVENHKNFSNYWNKKECEHVEDFDKHRLVSLASIEKSKAIVIHIPCLKSEIAATTWALALRNALAESLSVDYSELGWTSQQHGLSKGASYDIILFDNAAGGSDYCLKAKENLLKLFVEARRFLVCHANCDSVCLECLLSRETQVMARLLNRNEALKALGDDFFAQLEVPEMYRYWGENTKYVQNFYTHLVDCLSNPLTTKVRLYLSGNMDDWNIANWPLRDEIRNHSEKIELVIDKALWSSVEKNEFQKYDIDELMYLNRNFGYVETVPEVGNGKKIKMEEIRAGQVYQYVLEKFAFDEDGEYDSSDSISSENDVEFLFWNAPHALHAFCGTCESFVEKTEKTSRDLYFIANPVRFKQNEKFQINDFAEQILKKACSSADLLPNVEISKIEYYDRYVQTPIALRVLGEFVKFLQPREFKLITSGSTFTGSDKKPKSNVLSWICDYPADGDGRKGHLQPYRKPFYKKVMNKILGNDNAEVDVLPKIQHDREMYLTYKNGEQRLIRFTGGMGMWIPSEDINYWNGASTKNPYTVGLEKYGRMKRTFDEEASVIADAKDFDVLLSDSTSVIISKEAKEV